MHFCENCNNMYYIKLIDDETNIEYYCKKCGNTNKDLIKFGNCIFKERINNTTQNTKNIINKYTVLDNTLPRTNSIKCPNDECGSNKPDFDTSEREIIYIRYDNRNLKYVYLCSHCNSDWTIND